MRRGIGPLYVVVLAVMLLGDGLVGAQEKMQIDINTADEATLMTLNHIGKRRAQAIIRHRQEEGRFKTIEDIKDVSGIGNRVFEAIKEKITVGAMQK
ncbi:hypothetical protein NKDENANG_00056 [Candidatus Entotheonellaceae bacterium PAL068K]